MKREDAVSKLRQFSSVVIWGLRTEINDTQHHIHRHFYNVLRKLEFPVIWCDDKKENAVLVHSDSLVFSYNGSCAFLPYKKDVSYALLNTVEPLSECKDYVRLRIYGTVPIENDSELWSSEVAFHKESHMLWQPWATDLLPDEFYPPVFSQSHTVHWIGSIWNDDNNHGNINNIEKLKDVLSKRGLSFVHSTHVSDEENVQLVRSDRIAPAIGGDIQIATNMLPCRVWKNISYGQLGVTNLPKTKEVFGDSILMDTDIDNLIERALSISESEYKERTVYQQIIVANEHTYLNWLYNLGTAFERLREI